MAKKRRKNGWLWLCTGLLLIIIILIGFYFYREKMKKDFDKLINTKYVLRVDYGIITQEKKLKEKFTIIKRTLQENYYYLYITEDNLLFTYYTDWYYNIDPLKGNILDYKKQLKKETTENILKAINEKEEKDLFAKVKEDYLPIRINNEDSYIKKGDLQLILQDHDILLDIYI